jgi:beta-glucosidase
MRLRFLSRTPLIAAGLGALTTFSGCSSPTGSSGELASLPPQSRKTGSPDIAAIFPEGDSKPIYHEGWIDLNKNGVKDAYEDPAVEIEKRVDDLLARMTKDEKASQLCTLYAYQVKGALPDASWKTAAWKDGMGNMDEQLNTSTGFGPGWRIGEHNRGMNRVQRFFIEETRLGIPVDYSNEGIAGVKYPKSTSFPKQIGLGASFDRDLIKKVGEITAREGAALGYTNVYSPILEVNRDQRWGRYEEAYGECPFLVSELGREQILGMQENGVVASPKHFAVYGLSKGARGWTAQCDAQCGPRDLEMIHMWPWRTAFREGKALGVMTAYNDWDGVCTSGDPLFLTTKLREEYGFRGYTVSDSSAVSKLFNQHHVAKDESDAIRMYIEAGGNVKTDFDAPGIFIKEVRRMLADGTLAESVVDSRVRDVLRVKFWLGLFDNPYCGSDADAARIVSSPENQAVALRASREALVLLKNKSAALPLDRAKLKRIAVVGPNAANTAYAKYRYGSSEPEVVSVLAGIKALAGPDITVETAKGCDFTAPGFPETESYPRPMEDKEKKGIADAVEVAGRADVIVAVLGDGGRTIGESCERTSLDLPGRQDDLLRALYATGKPVVLVVLGGRPMSFNWANEHIPAILQAWQPGAHGGTAVAEALFGDYNPGGKSPGTYPRSVGQLPMHFPFKPGSQAPSGSPMARLDGVLYSFGHGLSYTTFGYKDIKVEPAVVKPDEKVRVSFTVTNTGARAGDEVPQLYLRQEPTSITTYEKNLRGFERIHLNPGESRRVTLTLDPQEHLWLINPKLQRVVEPGRVKVMVGSASDDIRLSDTFRIAGPGGAGDTAPAKEDRAVASGETKSHPASAVLDGDTKTRWETNETPAWLQVRLGKPIALTEITIDWHEGDKRPHAFEIQGVSAIGSWATVFTGVSSGKTGPQRVTFPAFTTESLRIVFTDGKPGDKISIRELTIPGMVR